MDFLGLRKVHLVMDRGFYSAENITGLYKEHHKFLMGVKLSLTFVKKQLDAARSSIRQWTNYNERHEVFAASFPLKWRDTQDRPYKGDTIKAEKAISSSVLQWRKSGRG